MDHEEGTTKQCVCGHDDEEYACDEYYSCFLLLRLLLPHMYTPHTTTTTPTHLDLFRVLALEDLSDLRGLEAIGTVGVELIEPLVHSPLHLRRLRVLGLFLLLLLLHLLKLALHGRVGAALGARRGRAGRPHAHRFDVVQPYATAGSKKAEEALLKSVGKIF